MSMVVHILNGDSLGDRFPERVSGKVMVARECLVDGPVKAENLESFFLLRTQFIGGYPDCSEAEYRETSLSEFEAMQAIPAGSEVNFWFEDDLFCQTNFWFCLHLLRDRVGDSEFFLVRPHTSLRYGFGGLDEKGLIAAFDQRQQLTQLADLLQLWPLYQHQELLALQELGTKLEQPYPFLLPAINAFARSLPTGDNPGYLHHSILTIMEELGTREFGPVFQEFCQREAIYGLGDLQVKRIFDEVVW